MRKTKPQAPWSPKAKYLFRLFTALRVVKEGRDKWIFISACKSSRTCFHKLERILEECSITDEVGYLVAQLNYWGISRTFPSHVISPYAIPIYKRWREEQVPKAKENLSQEVKMLRDLCRLRGESEEQVLTLLKDSGVFTQQFLESKEAYHNVSKKK